MFTWTPEFDQQRITWPGLTIKPTSFRRTITTKLPRCCITGCSMPSGGFDLRPTPHADQPLIDPILAGQLRGHRVLIITEAMYSPSMATTRFSIIC